MSWQEELKKGIRRAEELAPILGWSEEETAERAAVAERFPMMITPYYLSLVDPADPRDPIGRMCIPSLEELDAGGSFDTSGEADNTKLEGMQHKYDQTVLLLSTNQCAMYCRHCFRKRLVGLSDEELNKRIADTHVLIGDGAGFEPATTPHQWHRMCLTCPMVQCEELCDRFGKVFADVK